MSGRWWCRYSFSRMNSLEQNHFFQLHPKEIEAHIQPNNDNPYKRIIRKATWVPPEQIPYLFHTAPNDAIKNISPALCQSFDYRLNGRIIPVTYAFPWAHVNRIKGFSEVWGSVKTEAFQTTGLPYTYLTIEDGSGQSKGRIRLGSTMLDGFLLAALNSGYVFRILLTELNTDGSTTQFQEYISLLDLPVIDAQQFRQPSPVAFSTASLETHLPFDIARPDLVGFLDLKTYLAKAPRSPGKTVIESVGNMLYGAKSSLLTGMFDQLVIENIAAMQKVADEPRSRIFVGVDLTTKSA